MVFAKENFLSDNYKKWQAVCLPLKNVYFLLFIHLELVLKSL